MRKHFPRVVIGVCLVFFSLISFVFSDTTQHVAAVTREEILFAKIPVVTASKKLQKSSEAPAAITVITAEEIRDSGARTIAEAIQYVAGVNVFGFQGVNIRGVGTGGRILLLLDGRRNNDVYTGGFEIGFERTVEKVKRIEIIKGPASSLYGTNAFGGIINIITKDAADQPGVTAQVDGGNFSTQDYTATYGHVKKNVDAIITAYGHFDEGTNQVAPNDGTRDGDLYGKVRWKDFVFGAGYRRNRADVPAIGGFLTPDSFIKRNDSFEHVQYQKDYGNRWSVFSQLSLQNELLFFRGRILQELDISDFRAEGEARANYKFSDRDNITFGTELRHDRTNNEKTDVTETYRSANRSLFAENEFDLNRLFIFTAGIRWDNNSIFGNSVNPRVGVIVNASDDTILKFFAGTAFRGPEFVDLFTDTPVGGFLIQHNPFLKPEKVRSVEGEISHQLNDSLRVRFNVYHNALHDLITVALKQNFVFTFANLGNASTYGVESGIEGKLTDELDFFANHALQYGRDTDKDLDLPLIPRNTINTGIIYHSTHGFRIGFYNKWVDSRPTTNVTGNRINLDSYFKSDLVLSLDLPARLQLQTGVYNLFDVDYSSDFASPQRGIQVLAGISYRSK